METQINIVSNVDEMNQLIFVFEDVFEMKELKKPSDSYLRNLLQKDTFFAVVAKLNETVIAGLSVYILDQYYSTKPLAYIYDLAVLTKYQRKGVGKKLIEFTKQFCREKNYEEIFVQADKIDDYAIDFYRSTNASQEEDVVHFSYELKQI